MSFRFSETLEELYIKPVIWLLPLLYIVPKDKLKFSDLGITLKNLFPSMYLSLALGVGFAFLGLLANFAKYGAKFYLKLLGAGAIILAAVAIAALIIMLIFCQDMSLHFF